MLLLFLLFGVFYILLLAEHNARKGSLRGNYVASMLRQHCQADIKVAEALIRQLAGGLKELILGWHSLFNFFTHTTTLRGWLTKAREIVGLGDAILNYVNLGWHTLSEGPEPWSNKLEFDLKYLFLHDCWNVNLYFEIEHVVFRYWFADLKEVFLTATLEIIN